MLSARGLLTPNIYTGAHQFHSVLEWASVQDMAASAATIVELVKLWAEPEWATRQVGVTEPPHLLDDREQRGALIGQLVLDARRRLGVAVAQDQLLLLERA